MKRTLSLLAVALLGLTACTDQPAPVEPETTATVTETVTADPAENLASPEQVASMIARVMEDPEPGEIPISDEAINGLQDAITLSAEEHNCPIVADAVPEVAAFGLANAQEDNPDAMRGLAAFGFTTVEDAAAFTENLKAVLEQCEAANYEIAPLTHHTDEAFEIQIESSNEPAASVVVARNEYWVLTAVSTPPADLALSLTQIDQLDEMLR
ncbi:hypothetical protein A6F49_01645 [Enteractinococcus helveticum]|uniref:PknH-like extracellular domain-containing protein n=1 Tax=Enteractinococcus helveticum TaxID=1837282 RepID=A0A1B7LV00_9MICC|nr:hypothetical protein A6F49_01645 [Enteractinococcus helveticum]